MLIRKEGQRLIIEPVTGPTNIVELLNVWKESGRWGPTMIFLISRTCR